MSGDQAQARSGVFRLEVGRWVVEGVAGGGVFLSDRNADTLPHAMAPATASALAVALRSIAACAEHAGRA